MDHVIGKIRKRGSDSKYRKILSNQGLYEMPETLCMAVPYAPDHNLDEEAWFGLENFSERMYCIDILKEAFNSTQYSNLEVDEVTKLDFIWAYQEGNYYFQKINKSQFISKKRIAVGDHFKVVESSNDITINDIPDAIYIKSQDTLYFKKLSAISSIFKGIDSLYREATQEETKAFLEKEFITLSQDYDVDKVKQSNRKRIALAIDTLQKLGKEEKGIVFETIKDYCPELVNEDGKFSISNENDLKLLLYGIDQRFYTTPDGKEKRIANSVIKLGEVG